MDARIVTALFDVVGAFGLVTSFGARCIVALLTSLKVVGHGLRSAHGAGVVTRFCTSDCRNDEAFPGVALRRLEAVDDDEHRRVGLTDHVAA